MHGGENSIHGFQRAQPVGNTGNTVSKRSLRRLNLGQIYSTEAADLYELEEEEKQIGKNMRTCFGKANRKTERR